MAIYTRFGSEVTIIAVHMKTGDLNIKYIEDGEIVPSNISELKADAGIKEIHEAVEAVKNE